MREWVFDGITLCEMKRTEFRKVEELVNRALESTFLEPAILAAAGCTEMPAIDHEEHKLSEEDFFNKDGAPYKIIKDGAVIGGIFILFKPESKKGEVVLWGLQPFYQGQGVGQRIWKELEVIYADIETWELITPVAALKNIKFYVNKCGFHVVELIKDEQGQQWDMFRFEKRKDWQR